MDLLRELGELALASRLRRLSDALMADADRLYGELGVRFRPRWFPALQALARHAPLSITELAADIGLTHTAAGQIARQLLQAQWIEETPDPSDDRRRLLRLSPEGEQLLRRLARAWAAIRGGARELLVEARVDLLEDLERVEAAHARRSIIDRARARLDLPERERIRIVDYRPAYKKHFRALNEAWLLAAGGIEPHDAKLLADPNGRILRRGGALLFALADGEVAGACALIRHGDGLWELAKMAVAEPQRGRGIGTRLALAAIERARSRDARLLFLQTGHGDRSTQRLYRRLGFRRAPAFALPRPDYARPSTTMTIDLSGGVCTHAPARSASTPHREARLP